jgi:hypothetical protein
MSKLSSGGQAKEGLGWPFKSTGETHNVAPSDRSHFDDGFAMERAAPAPCVHQSAATILPPSHLNIEKLGELRSPALP